MKPDMYTEQEYMSMLPYEIWIYIIGYVYDDYRAICKIVCKYFYNLIESIEVRQKRQFFIPSAIGYEKFSRMSDYVYQITYENIAPEFMLYPQHAHHITFNRCDMVECSKIPNGVRELVFLNAGFDQLCLSNYPDLTLLRIECKGQKKRELNIIDLPLDIENNYEVCNEKKRMSIIGNFKIVRKELEKKPRRQ